MKKTIDEIINNENYERLNNALIDRSIEIAGVIRNEMLHIQVSEIGDYRVNKVKSRSGQTYSYLEMLTDDGAYKSLEDSECYCYAGDYNLLIRPATTRMRINFLNAASSIFSEIDRIKEERIKEIENLLK